MKRILLIISLLVGSISMSAQDESYSGATDSWPYLFKNFQHGVVHFIKGYKDLESDLNICIADGHLHYVDNGTILESETKEVTGAEINGKIFIAYNGEMMEVLANNENGYIAVSRLFDPTQMGKAEIGYGMTSSTYAASNLDLRAVTGLAQNILHSKVAEAATNAGYGEKLPIKETLCIIVGNNKINADKKEFQDLVGKEKATAFLKENKIKWTKAETLLPVVNFIAETVK